MKNADLKIWLFLAKKHGFTPQKKVDFLDEIHIFFQKLPIESMCPKVSPEILNRPPQGPGRKK